MTDTDLAFALAATFTVGIATVCGLRQHPEAMVRALSVVTLGFGVLLGAVLTFTAAERVPCESASHSAVHASRQAEGSRPRR